jgi:hypothetical protein
MGDVLQVVGIGMFVMLAGLVRSFEPQTFG